MSKRVITLGTWEGKPIEWIVLKEEKFGTLVISKEKLFNCKFNNNRSDSNRWKDSLLRKYVNEEFFKKAFTEEEKKKIVNVYLSDPDGTKDNVFVLSKIESENLMTQNERAVGSFSWTRSPNTSYNNCTYIILGDGGLSYEYVDYSRSIRPAMYVRECDSEETSDNEISSAEPKEEMSDFLSKLFGELKKAPK